jgi:HK97 gp10 family phage protein
VIRFPIRVQVSQNRIPGLGPRLRSLAGRNSEQTAKGIEASAKARVHVISGELRDSIEAIHTGPYTWTVLAGAPYAGFENYGTRFRPGHPFWEPAILEHQGKFLANLDRLLAEL